MATVKSESTPKSEAQEYLDMVYSSWPAVGFIQRQGRTLLKDNFGMTDEQAQAAVQEWIKSKGRKG